VKKPSNRKSSTQERKKRRRMNKTKEVKYQDSLKSFLKSRRKKKERT